MKVDTTVSLTDGTKLVIESPSLVGETDILQLARVLQGESAQVVYGNGLALPSDFTIESRSEFMAVAVDDSPHGVRWHSYRVFVTRWPLQTQLSPGVVLEREDGHWLAYPGILDEFSARRPPALLVREPWLVLLGKVITIELDPYLQLAQRMNRKFDAWVGREIRTRCHLFDRQNLGGFFESRRHSFLWGLGSNWARWEESNTPVEERLHELKAADPGVEMDINEFQLVCQSHGLVTEKKNTRKAKIAIPPWLKRQAPVELFSFLRGDSDCEVRRLSEFKTDEELMTVFLGGKYPEIGPDSSLSDRELALVRDWSPEQDAAFSYGGSPDLDFDNHPEIWDSFPAKDEKVSLTDLLDHVWWWKTCVEDFVPATESIVDGAERQIVREKPEALWPQALLDLFRDNWEQSAYFYEFRARYKGRYQWSPFGKPWVKLNYTQRGILAYAWPPKHVGRHRIQPKLSPAVLERMKSVISVRLQHQFQSPRAVATDRVLDEIERLAHAAGLSVPGRGKGRREKIGWRALQYLDLQHLLGGKIPDNESGLKHAIANYEAACGEIGWEP